MNIINQLECDSSSDSDGIVMEDRAAEEDSDHREIESDLAETIVGTRIEIAVQLA